MVSLVAEFSFFKIGSKKQGLNVRFVVLSLERMLLLPRFSLTSLAIKGSFAKRLAPATWKQGCIMDLIKKTLVMHNLFRNSFMF